MNLLLPALFFMAMAAFSPQAGAAAPIALHPENPHYFAWRGKPVVVVSSGEHYGAVINTEFDYHKYLETLAAGGMNYTRIFSGAYVEPEGAFNIARNTLAPEAGRFLCPWARSTEPGYAGGGNKFDLSRWDEAYFARLKDFVETASQKGVIVELTLFCPMYEDPQWALSPMKAANNVNGAGVADKHTVHTLDGHGGLLVWQEALVRKCVTELNGMDNVIFEICNEPYFGGVTLEWQHHIAEVITATENGLPNRHLIAQNIANNAGKIVDPHPAVSIFNFHYAEPLAVAENLSWNKVIGNDETGFSGTDDVTYRKGAWNFILAGGGLFNHLDYSFVAGKEDGTFEYPKTQPGGGNPGFRRQMKVLHDFITGLDFIRMKPDTTVIRQGVPEGATAQALVAPGRAIAVYFTQKNEALFKELEVDLTPGKWLAEWVDPITGNLAASTRVAGGGLCRISVPAFQTDIALRLTHLLPP